MGLQANTKYSEIVNDIKKQIIDGKINSGEKIPSENQLSKQYGVSRHTVRKALSILINQGYVVSEHGKGTFCRKQNLMKKNSKNIGVITTYISDYIFPQVIKGIDEVLTNNGYSIILKNTGNSQKKEAGCLEDMLTKDIEGLIVEPSRSEVLCKNENLYLEYEARGIPFVFIQGRYLQMKDKPSVVMNDKQGGYMATKHLIELGHRQLVGIFKMDDYQGNGRYKGFVKALKEAGIPYDPDNILWFHTEDRRTKPAAMIRYMISEGRSIDGIVCYNDQTALDVLNALTELGIKVPEDISIVGHDDSFIARNAPVKLTTIYHPKELLGQMAAEMLLEILRGKQQKYSQSLQVIEPELIIRESTRKRE